MPEAGGEKERLLVWTWAEIQSKKKIVLLHPSPRVAYQTEDILELIVSSGGGGSRKFEFAIQKVQEHVSPTELTVRSHTQMDGGQKYLI
jgi:hypothetical protein